MPRFFDRINRYRIAAAFLSFPTAWILIDDQNFIGGPKEYAIRIVYRIGVGVLLAAVAIDWWDVYAGKRKIKKMMNQRIKDGD